MAGNPPVDVQEFGQSIWYDNISRRLISSGELQRMVDEDGVLGVTSNPTIFQKAIGDSTEYDEAISPFLDLEPADIFEKLAVEDIQNALDILRPIYDRTEGGDGYVSLEVSPLIANDTQTTVTEAIRLAGAVDRPNLMVKIPATEAGIPAIEQTIAAGINVNVTLIFSVSNYERVMEAYIRGLERRLEDGEDVTHLASVASFFLSRIDAVIDRMLDNNIREAQGRDIGRASLNEQIKGKTAIANAKIAYKRFRDIFHGDRFMDLRNAGARAQRPLWASTGTKNPAYPDTLYVDSLIGRETVNTVPPKTLKSFKDHGTAADTLGNGLEDAERTLDMLAEVGIDLDQVTAQLQIDGVESFVNSYRELIDQVRAKRDVLQTGIMQQQDYVLSVYQDDFNAALDQFEKLEINARLWGHDGTIWKDHTPTAMKIKKRLGWLDVLETIDRDRLKQLQANVGNGKFEHVVLLGMGGSSLAPEVLSRTFGQQDGFPALLVLDSTDPTQIRYIEDQIDIGKTLFIVSSKSGGTVETLMFFHYFYNKTGQNGDQFIAITDPGTSMESLAREHGFRDAFMNPENIGGRYSALSYFGMVPAAVMGLDLDRMWAEAERMMTACAPLVMPQDHPGMTLGAFIGTIGRAGRDKVSIITSPSFDTFGNWIEQLLAESTGKEGKGLLPVVGATVGNPHDYNTDRLFIYVKLIGDDTEAYDAGIRALREAGHPRLVMRLKDKYELAGEFFRWEYATAIVGHLLGINPFDEPNVAESKQNTGRLLEYYQAHGTLPRIEPSLTEDNIALYMSDKQTQLLRQICLEHSYDAANLTNLLAVQINSSIANDYFAVLAYLPQTPEIEDVFAHIRRRLRHVSRRAVTIGYGPRFLHSTGQLHKGGANNGIFLQITTDDNADLPIPGQPYSFGTLKAAQAAGDLEALIGKGRRVMRLHISGDMKAGLQKILDAIELAGERRR